MPSINIPEEIFRRLVDKAEALNTSIDALVQSALQGFAEANGNTPHPLTGDAWRREFAAWTKEIEGRTGCYPPGFRVDDSREAIYRDREDQPY
jgi:hypothetical protein